MRGVFIFILGQISVFCYIYRMKFNKTILESGLRIVTIPMADNPSVTVLVMVEAGSKYETKKTNGLSHFLEHMVFKGTPRRPKASDISRELDSIGAQYNAFTTQEFTGYYAKTASKHFDAALDIVSDMYLNPLFEQSEIAKEKGVIIEEIRMYQDLPQRKVHDVFGELLYGDQPAGWSVLGSEETVNSFSSADFVAYRGGHYVAASTTVIVAGSIDEKDAIAKISRAFLGVSTGNKEPKLPVREEQSAPAIKTSLKETDQTHIVIGVRTFPVLDPRIPAMHVLSTVLGGSMSSRLFSRLRDELGMCYYVSASHDAATDHGDLAISAGVDNSRVAEAVKEILTQCSKLKDEPIPEAELKKAKDYIAGTTLLQLETSDVRAEFSGFQEALKHMTEHPDDIIAKINKVTSADVQKLAQDIFVDAGLNMAIVGRFKEGEAFKPFFHFTA